MYFKIQHEITREDSGVLLDLYKLPVASLR